MPALAIARDPDDPRLLARVLTACGATWLLSADAALAHLDEAIEVARGSGGDCRLSQTLGLWAYGALLAGDPTGDVFTARLGRWVLRLARWLTADLVGTAASLCHVLADADADADATRDCSGLRPANSRLAMRLPTKAIRPMHTLRPIPPSGRNTLATNCFDAAWADGSGLPTED